MQTMEQVGWNQGLLLQPLITAMVFEANNSPLKKAPIENVDFAVQVAMGGLFALPDYSRKI